MEQCRGAAGGGLKRLPPSRLELPSLIFLLPRLLLTAEAIIKLPAMPLCSK